MISKKLCTAALTLVLGSVMAAAHAAPVTYTFTATVDSITQTFGSGDDNHDELAGLHVEMGDKVIGSITWDVAAASSRYGPVQDGSGMYESYRVADANIQYTFLSGRNSYSITQQANVSVYNDMPYDRFVFDAFSTRTAQGEALYDLTTLVFDDMAGNLWNSTAVPTSFDTALAGKYADLMGNFGQNTGTAADSSLSFSASLTSLQLQSVSAVPEPGTYAMLLAGLGAIGIVARRRCNNAA